MDIVFLEGAGGGSAKAPSSLFQRMVKYLVWFEIIIGV